MLCSPVHCSVTDLWSHIYVSQAFAILLQGRRLMAEEAARRLLSGVLGALPLPGN